MSRDQGFTTADVHVGLLDDPKVRKLWRRLKDPAAMDAAIVTYLAVLLGSWAAGERVTAEDVAPLWAGDLDLSALQHVGLLDPEGRIPEHAWSSWFGTADERREKARARWRAWAERNRTQPFANGLPMSTVPTVPTVPTVTRARAREVSSKTTGSNGSAAPTSALKRDVAMQPIGKLLEGALPPFSEILRNGTDAEHPEEGPT